MEMAFEVTERWDGVSGGNIVEQRQWVQSM